MKILVTTKRVPDPEARLRVRPDGCAIDLSDLRFVLNPFDAIAVEEALRIKEARSDVEIVAVTIGTDDSEDVLRTALAMGADRAILVVTDESPDPWGVACILNGLCLREAPDVVLMGKQAIDDDCNQASQFLAAIAGWPQASFASSIVLDSNGVPSALVGRETDDGLEQVRVSLPAVISVDLRLNEPRYASLPSLMKAKRKPIERVDAVDLAGTGPAERKSRVVRMEIATSARVCKRVADVSELMRCLRQEAKVL